MRSIIHRVWVQGGDRGWEEEVIASPSEDDPVILEKAKEAFLRKTGTGPNPLLLFGARIVSSRVVEG